MSYEKVSSINEKNRTVTSACNNIRPLYYEVGKYREDISLDDFRVSVMKSILFGDYHLNNRNHKYNLIACRIKATDEYKELDDMIWNFDDHYSDEWRKEHYNENIEKLNKLILKHFELPLDTNNYVIENGYYYIKRINRWTYSYTPNIDKAMIFKSYEVAQGRLCGLGNQWKVKLA